MDIDKIAEQQCYQELKTELRIQKKGGIFPVLYPDEAVIRPVIGQLRKDWPESCVFSLALNTRQSDFLAFFEKSFEQPCDTCRLFHVTGLENLPDAIRTDFMGYLQQLRDHSDAFPFALVLWISPEFEHQLFFLAPELYWQATCVYDFSELLPADEERLGRPGPIQKKAQALPSDKIVAYLEKVIWQYENWKAVKREKKPFLIGAMAHADLNSYYVLSRFSNKKGNIFLLDDLLRVFMENKTINFLTLLGASGTGKTAFALHYFVHLARQYVQTPLKRRIPIFISLRSYPGKLGTEEFLIEAFRSMFGVKLSFIALQDLLLRGNFVFFVDGFDEMASASDRYLTANNLGELIRLSLRNIILENGIEKPQPGNKVFLLCKPHYLLGDVREFDMAKAGYTFLYQDHVAKENCQIVRLNPKTFDDAGIRKYIASSAGDGITARNVLSVITDNYNLNKLSAPSLIREIVIRTASRYRDRKEININDLYRSYTGLWIDREDWRLRIKPAGRRALMCQMALKMFQKGSGFFLHFSELSLRSGDSPEKDPRRLAADLRNEMMACEFLTCDTQGNYRFVHRSFMNYFLAEKYFSHIREGKALPLVYEHLEEEPKAFLKYIISSEKSNLRNLNLEALMLEKINLYQADLSGANLNKARLSQAVMMNANLRRSDFTAADLSRSNLTRAGLREADLSSADLNGARLRGADLGDAKLNGSDLRGADLRGAKLRRARMAWANFKEADLGGADLTGAILTDADLTGANLEGAILKDADLTGANLSRAVLIRVQAIGAGLNRADLTHADLSEADFAWAKFQRATLALANLHKTRLREADLTWADLKDCTGRQADFRWARLECAKLGDARLQEADLTGADLSKARLQMADLSWSNLNNVRLPEADLTEARLNMAKLRGGIVTKANLTRADLTWADLSEADLSGTDLTEADLGEADLTGAVLRLAKLNHASLKGASLRGADLGDAECDATDFDGADLTDARIPAKKKV